jgi:hypothetical protein
MSKFGRFRFINRPVTSRWNDISNSGSAPSSPASFDYTKLKGIWDLKSTSLFPASQGLYVFTTATFTRGTATGRTGPSLSVAIAGLTGPEVDTWKNNIAFFNTSSGIQLWTVPASGTYRIAASGAQGGPSFDRVGGFGASMQGDFVLTAGEVLRILVGQQGLAGGASTGGGGGSFVVRSPYNTTGSILVIAGGGGGAADGTSSLDRNGVGGTTANSGTSGRDNLRAGGTSGSGGTGTSGAWGGAGGGGFTGNGGNALQSGSTVANSGGFSFTNGGTGGASGTSYPGDGGFGGGGGSSWGAGGGGGYSGGAADDSQGSSSDKEGGGGGGSFNSGTNQSNTGGVQSGHGQVIITRL